MGLLANVRKNVLTKWCTRYRRWVSTTEQASNCDYVSRLGNHRTTTLFPHSILGYDALHCRCVSQNMTEDKVTFESICLYPVRLSPLQVSAFGDSGEGDGGDSWEVTCVHKGSENWARDESVRLKHVSTKK